MSAAKVRKSANVRTAGSGANVHGRSHVRIEIEHAGVTDAEALLADLGLDLRAFATQAGLLMVKALIDAEAEQLAGPRYAHQTAIDRWGTQSGYVRMGGQKLAVERPRLRNKKTGKEEPLTMYQAFQQPEPQSDAVYQRLIGGLSTRRYQKTVDDVVEGYGASRSAVSRQMVAATAAKLKQLHERDLSNFDVRVLLVDAVRVGGSVYTVVAGIDSGGVKQVLGFREGATENAAVLTDLLAELIDRGLPNERDRGLLAVLDGSKALAKAVRSTFGSRVAIQRCCVHKLRNVLEYLPESLHAEYRRKIKAAYAMTSAADARRALERIVKELERINASAANSMREGMEETLTVHRLGLPATLRRSLWTTNMIESVFSHSRHLMKNVRSWRTSEQKQRWTATVLLEAEAKFRRIKGHKEMPVLIKALSTIITK
jgi:putative transposase